MFLPMTIFTTRAHALIRRNVPGIHLAPRHPEFASVRTKTLDIDNVVYRSPIFRKIHLETAVAGQNHIVHLVLHPHATEYPIPILSMDVVVLSGRPTMCIADPCPATPDLSLPSPAYEAAVRELQARHDVFSSGNTVREPPEWGREIFSKTCVLVRGNEKGAYDRFQAYALDLLDFHLRQYSAWPEDDPRAQSAATTLAAHDRYRRCQLRNDRTRKMLVGAFDGDAARADAYMRYVFD